MGIGRAVAAAAMGITGLGLLTACDLGIATQSYSDSADVERSFSSVRFVDDVGNVAIRAGETASVRREVHYGDEKPGADTFRVRDGVLELDSCGRRDCWIDYEVTVPAGTTVTGQLASGTVDVAGVAAVTVRADAGEVTVTDVAGAVNVESGSGSVTIADIGGALVAKVDSGGVRADDVRGGLTLEAASGSVEARGIGGATDVASESGDVVVELTAPRDVRVDAEAGDVEVTVPRASYRVVTSTDSGTVDSEVDDDSSGEHRLDLHTDSGDITLTQV